MATFAKQSFCVFFIVLYTCFQAESRQSKFFSKYVHPKINVLLSYPTPAPQPITSHISYVPTQAPVGANYGPAPAPETLGANYGPASAPAPITLGSNDGYVKSESNWYYGLYAKGTSEIPQENAEFPSEISVENPVFSRSNFPSEQENIFDEDREENEFWNSNYKGYNNGENYYDVNRRNYRPRVHEPARENNYVEGYYNGNYDKSKYEFDSMEEYEKQEGYGGVQHGFIP